MESQWTTTNDNKDKEKQKKKKFSTRRKTNEKKKFLISLLESFRDFGAKKASLIDGKRTVTSKTRLEQQEGTIKRSDRDRCDDERGMFQLCASMSESSGADCSRQYLSVDLNQIGVKVKWLKVNRRASMTWVANVWWSTRRLRRRCENL